MIRSFKADHTKLRQFYKTPISLVSFIICFEELKHFRLRGWNNYGTTRINLPIIFTIVPILWIHPSVEKFYVQLAMYKSINHRFPGVCEINFESFYLLVLSKLQSNSLQGNCVNLMLPELFKNKKEKIVKKCWLGKFPI